MKRLRNKARGRWIGAATAIALLLPAAATSAQGIHSLQCSPESGSSRTGLFALAEDIRSRDGFYEQLVKWNGVPSQCVGSVASDSAENEGWIEFAWPDQSKFKTEFSAPEIFVATYSSINGLSRGAEVIERFHDYARQRGLRIDWHVAHAETDGKLRIVEYRDEDQGVNGIVRFTYDDKGRLISASLSMAP